MRQLILGLTLIGLLAYSPSSASFDACPQFDNHGRILFDAAVTPDGMACRYSTPPVTPSCPTVAPSGAINTDERHKRSGVVICIYQTVGG